MFVGMAATFSEWAGRMDGPSVCSVVRKFMLCSARAKDDFDCATSQDLSQPPS